MYKQIHAKIYVTSASSRISSVRDADPTATPLHSGKYRPGYCSCEGLLLPGTYIIVLSTYEAGVTGRFVCTVRGGLDTFRIVELPQE